MNGQVHYASIADILQYKKVKTYRTTSEGLVAVHKRNSVGSYYWDYYRYYENIFDSSEAGYYYTGSTSKFER